MTKYVVDVLNSNVPPADALFLWARSVVPLLVLAFFRHDRKAYYFVSASIAVEFIQIIFRFVPAIIQYGALEPMYYLIFWLPTLAVQVAIIARYTFGRPSRIYYDLAQSGFHHS